MKTLITQREGTDKYGVPVDSLESNYIRYFSNLGCELYPVSNFISRTGYLFDQDVELLILTGGGSLSGEFYHPVKPETDSPCRDYIEKALFEEAIKSQIPVLAICRGMQYVNALLGGSISVLSGLPVLRRVGEDHPVSFGEEIVYVNNYHNDGVYLNQLATDLTPIGIDKENGVVEAFMSDAHKTLGVQFHPERNIQDYESRGFIDLLIENFIHNRTNKYSGK